MPTVSTARGPVSTDQLGFVLMHEHIVLQSPGVRDNWPETMNRDAVIQRSVAKLNEAKAAGVETLVDLTTMDNGRDVPLVAEIAAQTDLHVIVATGMWRLVPRYFTDKSADQLAALFVRDINEGVQGTGVRAAIIKNASDDRVISGLQDLAFRASARAHRQTGVPLSTHTNVFEQSGLDQQRIYTDEGVDLSRVIIGHSGDTNDLDYLERLLDNGSYLGMDRFGLDQFGAQKFLDTAGRVRVIARLCEQGYADRLVLSHDACCVPDGRGIEFQEQTWPNWRYTHIPREVIPSLREAGVSEVHIRLMTRDTPRRIFERQGPY
jgi:phosphotriesterase-related protein